jgi:hypothetical protein
MYSNVHTSSLDKLDEDNEFVNTVITGAGFSYSICYELTTN